MNAFLLRLEKKARMSNLSNTIQYDTGGNSNRQAIRQKKKKKGRKEDQKNGYTD